MRRFLASFALVAVATSAACGGGAPASDSKAADAAAGKLRTAWGDPDLQGMWDSLERAPLERPSQFGTREFMTEQEAAERAKRAGRGGGLPSGDEETAAENLVAADNRRNATADALPDDAPGRRIVGAEY